jgi:hypothetical protein
VVAFVILLSCNPKPNKIPDDVLSQKNIEKILIDISMAESYSQIAKDTLHRAGIKDIDSLAVYYKVIFDHHHITKDQFDKSMDWYKSHPDLLDTVYMNISNRVNKLQNSGAKKP